MTTASQAVNQQVVGMNGMVVNATTASASPQGTSKSASGTDQNPLSYTITLVEDPHLTYSEYMLFIEGIAMPRKKDATNTAGMLK